MSTAEVSKRMRTEAAAAAAAAAAAPPYVEAVQMKLNSKKERTPMSEHELASATQCAYVNRIAAVELDGYTVPELKCRLMRLTQQQSECKKLQELIDILRNPAEHLVAAYLASIESKLPMPLQEMPPSEIRSHIMAVKIAIKIAINAAGGSPFASDSDSDDDDW